MANKHYQVDEEIEVTLKVRVKIVRLSNYQPLTPGQIEANVKAFKEEIKEHLQDKLVNDYYREEVTETVDDWTYEVEKVNEADAPEVYSGEEAKNELQAALRDKSQPSSSTYEVFKQGSAIDLINELKQESNLTCSVDGGVCPYETKDRRCRAQFKCENQLIQVNLYRGGYDEDAKPKIPPYRDMTRDDRDAK
jgi:hypothetical protein